MAPLVRVRYGSLKSKKVRVHKGTLRSRLVFVSHHRRGGHIRKTATTTPRKPRRRVAGHPVKRTGHHVAHHPRRHGTTMRHRKPMSALARQHISAALRGKKHPHKGVHGHHKPMSAAARKRMSAARRGKKHPHKGHKGHHKYHGHKLAHRSHRQRTLRHHRHTHHHHRSRHHTSLRRRKR